ncbi:MAG: cytochrome c family protein [Hyphomonas sp.]|uniref:cytochrome c family protein n=1 Tax=Hyphomonas sp. TaxID=87 RepID=UPI00349FE7F9
MRFDTKRLTLAMASALALTLAACGGSGDPSAPAPAAAPTVEADPVEAAAPAEVAPAETPAPTEASAPAAGGTDYASYTGDAAKGKRVFAQCMTCHVVQEGRNNVGPSLYAIVGRGSGTIPGFKYSEANQNSNVIWTEENLFVYLEKPTQFIPGTIMAYPGLRNPQDRADLIAYLKNPA